MKDDSHKVEAHIESVPVKVAGGWRASCAVVNDPNEQRGLSSTHRVDTPEQIFPTEGEAYEAGVQAGQNWVAARAEMFAKRT